MKLHELQPSPGSHHPRKRVGRGPGSGHGKTSTRGQKGQGARTSFNLPKTFEGGQTRLNRFDDGAEIRPESLIDAGLVKDVGAGIKVLGTGDLNRKLIIHAHRFSAEARRKIEAAGGTVAVIEVPAPIRPKTKRAKNQPKPAAPAPVETAETPEKAQAADAAAAPAKVKKEKSKPAAEKGQAAPKASSAPDSPRPEKGKKKG